MKIIIHRGSRQIGGSIIELESQNTRIILDVGQVLPDNNRAKKTDFIERPPVKGLFKGDIKGVDGVFISHGHGDHIGMLPYLIEDIPLFMGLKTAEIYNMTGRFTGNEFSVKPYGFLEHKKPITLGNFTVVPYLIDHSAYDAYGFIIYAEGKSVIYTGDIREHGKKARLTEYFRNRLPRKADAILMEGTMLGRLEENIETEDEISSRAEDIMRKIKRPAFVLQSTTNIDRLVAMYHAAKKSGRIFVIDIFAANIMETVGGSVGNILNNSRIFYPKSLTQNMYLRGEDSLMSRFACRKIKVDELNGMDNYCMLIRGSMLGALKKLKDIDGSTFIYSMWRGYEEREDVKQILHFAESKEMKLEYLHTSGHGTVESLKKIVNSCRPERVIPIHTENPEKYKELFKNVDLIKDGMGLKI